jgi:hypothetical protein
MVDEQARDRFTQQINFLRVDRVRSNSFHSKTNLIVHYKKTLGALHHGDQLMVFETEAATSLVNKYFKS